MTVCNASRVRRPFSGRVPLEILRRVTQGRIFGFARVVVDRHLWSVEDKEETSFDNNSQFPETGTPGLRLVRPERDLVRLALNVKRLQPLLTA